MSRVLAPFAWMALGAALVMLVGRMTADVALAKVERAEAQAVVFAERAVEFEKSADSLADSLALVRAAYADSLARWERSRADAAASRERAAAQASEARAALVATIDTAEAAAFASYEASRDSIDAANATTIATLESETAALKVEVGLLGSEVTALRESLGAAGVALTMTRAANEGLRRALAVERRKSSVVTIVAGGVLAKLAYDALAGG